MQKIGKIKLLILFLFTIVTMLLFSDCTALDNVYVCTGQGAHVWHCKRSCRGLKNCDGSIVSMSVDDLSSKYTRRCEICY